MKIFSFLKTRMQILKTGQYELSKLGGTCSGVKNNENVKLTRYNDISNPNWKTLKSSVDFEGYSFSVTQTPACQLKITGGDRDIFETSYQNQGVKSSDIKNDKHARNLWACEFSVTDKDNNTQTVDRSIRHGVISAYGLKKNPELRKQANIKAGKEILTAMLFINPEKLKAALDGHVVDLRFTSMSLLTPIKNPILRKLFKSEEKQQLKDQMAVWKNFSESPDPIKLKIYDQDGQLKEVKVRAKIAAFNFGVNYTAMSKWKVGAEYCKKLNKEGAEKLLGDLSSENIGGWVGEYLQDNKEISESERKAIQNLAKETKFSLKNTKNRHITDDDNPYKTAQNISVLAKKIGLDHCDNCKSGKDRMALQLLGIRYQQGLEYLNSKSNSEFFKLMASQSGDDQIQEKNKGKPGNIALRGTPAEEIVFGSSKAQKYIKKNGGEELYKILLGKQAKESFS